MFCYAGAPRRQGLRDVVGGRRAAGQRHGDGRRRRARRPLGPRRRLLAPPAARRVPTQRRRRRYDDEASPGRSGVPRPTADVGFHFFQVTEPRRGPFRCRRPALPSSTLRSNRWLLKRLRRRLLKRLLWLLKRLLKQLLKPATCRRYWPNGSTNIPISFVSTSKRMSCYCS